MARQFGLVADPVLAGTGYDALPVGKAIPAPVQSWPVTSIAVAGGATALDRNSEMRGGRGTPPPKPFKRAPTVTVEGNVYPEQLITLLLMALGATSRTGGSSGAAYTDTVLPAADSALQLPGAHLSWEMDGLFEQAAGAKLQSLSATFPEDGYGTFSATFVARWHKVLTSTPTWDAPDFEWLGDDDTPLMLRDVAAFEGGSSTAVDCLRSVSLEIPDIYREADFCARKERENIGAGSGLQRIWWPGGYRLAPRRNVNGSAEFRGLDAARENKQRIMAAEQFVIEVEGRPLATTPVVPEVLRFTAFNAVQQPSGDRTANRDDDLNTTVNWTAHTNDAGQDFQVEYVNNRDEGVAVPAA